VVDQRSDEKSSARIKKTVGGASRLQGGKEPLLEIASPLAGRREILRSLKEGDVEENGGGETRSQASRGLRS